MNYFTNAEGAIIMKLRKILISSVLFSTIVLSTSLLSYAENVVPISSAAETSVIDVYSDNTFNDPISPGIRIIAHERPLIISGTSGNIIQFSAEAFNDHNGFVPSAIKILSLPDENAGTLIYNSKPATADQSISVLTLSSLYYKPNNTDDAEFTFSADNTNITRCIIRQTNGTNNSPNTAVAGTVCAWTKINTMVGGYLSGNDPDGDSINFEIVSYPTKGLVTLTDKRTGHYVYHPYDGLNGEDSFSYRVCDSFGNYSDVCTVNVSVDRTKADVYNDTKDSYYASAVHDVVKSGIMQTHNTSDGVFFSPTDTVSRIDFLIMTMKSMGADEPSPVSSTPFHDDTSLSDIEKGYLNAAYRLGIVKGSVSDEKLIFMPDKEITGAEAAVMINGILGLPGTDSISVSSHSEDVPVWAVPSVSALTNAGIIDLYTTPAGATITRETAAVIFSSLMHRLS